MPLRPWDFPFGSVESRVAARLHLSRYNENRKHLTIFHSIPRPRMDTSRLVFGTWQEWPDGVLGLLVYIPPLWRKPDEPVPTCLDCHQPFKSTSEYSNVVGYEPSCLERHDPEPVTLGECVRL